MFRSKSKSTKNNTQQNKSTPSKTPSLISPSSRSQSKSRSNEFNTFNNSKSTSISSRTSLSSLKDSLPENPHIYDLSEIRLATKNFLLKPISSSSSSWKCLIDKKQSFVTQRKLRRPIDNSELKKKLSLLWNWVTRIQIVAGIADGLGNFTVVLEVLSGEEPMKAKVDAGGRFWKISLIEMARNALEGETGMKEWKKMKERRKMNERRRGRR